MWSGAANFHSKAVFRPTLALHSFEWAQSSDTANAGGFSKKHRVYLKAPPQT